MAIAPHKGWFDDTPATELDATLKADAPKVDDLFKVEFKPASDGDIMVNPDPTPITASPEEDVTDPGSLAQIAEEADVSEAQLGEAIAEAYHSKVDAEVEVTADDIARNVVEDESPMLELGPKHHEFPIEKLIAKDSSGALLIEDLIFELQVGYDLGVVIKSICSPGQMNKGIQLEQIRRHLNHYVKCFDAMDHDFGVLPHGGSHSFADLGVDVDELIVNLGLDYTLGKVLASIEEYLGYLSLRALDAAIRTLDASIKKIDNDHPF